MHSLKASTRAAAGGSRQVFGEAAACGRSRKKKRSEAIKRRKSDFDQL
jgi:hypothetical protein